MTSLENFRLTVFRKIAEQLSFRKAAEELYLTQPAVSLQIKALEEELEVLLFDRSGSKVKLTAAGATLLKYAEQSSATLREAKHQIALLSGSHDGTLTLGASTTIAQYVLPRLLSEFCTAHAKVRPRLMSGNTEQIVAAVDEEKVALGFIEGPPRARDLTVTPFLADELVLLAPAGHAWAERAEIDPSELAGAPLLMRERGSGTRQIVELALERHAVRRSALNVVMELDSVEAIKSAVAAGFGLGFVSRWAIAQDARLGGAFRMVKIKELELNRQFLMIAPKGMRTKGLAADFRNFVLSAARGQGAAPAAMRGKPARGKDARSR
jgi:LysR family transcriptional regulator, transcriptional activator of the cysJI operon